MPARKVTVIFLIALLAVALAPACRKRSNAFVIALSDDFSTLDPLGASTVGAADERVRVLLFNSLIAKNEKFEYVNELAENVQRSDEGKTVTFTLKDNVKFHDGRLLTSADVKYTLDTLLASNSGKSAPFFEGSGANKKSYITSIEAPDVRTVIIRLNKPWLALESNLVPVAIIPKDSAAQQKDRPLGSGPFKFVSFDSAQRVVEMEANPNYWQGAPNIASLRVRVIGDANALQAELRSGRVDLAPLPTNLSADAINSLAKDQSLQVKQFAGANIIHITFNTQSAPLDKAAVRQAIAYAIDRENIIKNLLLGQAQIAHSVLPESSWAYAAGTTYNYDPEKAKKLLDEAGFRDPDGDGPRMRFEKPIVFKISSASVNARQYSNEIQNSLKRIGIPIEIETVETNTLRDQLRLGQFQMTTGQWVGGNQDPIFLRDLFATSEIPTQDRPSKNRSRYSNPELDKILQEVVEMSDREKATSLYRQAQEIISRDVPLLPLWYPANMVVARSTVQNINVRGDGDWGFVRSLTVENK